MRTLLLFLVASFLAFMASPALADWSDDFESYAIGSIHGSGGWHGWDGSAAATGNVTTALAHGGTKSVEIAYGSDLVHEYTGVSADRWILTGWQYVPANFTGISYVVFLNQYADFGPYNWSSQVSFDATGVVTSEFEGAALPLIRDRWVEIRLDIDFTTNTQSIYYDGLLLTVKSWTEGITGGGSLNFAAMDLYANGASPVYYDDFTLIPYQPTATEATSWGNVKALFR